MHMFSTHIYVRIRFSFFNRAAILPVSPLCCLLLLLGPAACGATIVQTLSSRYAIVLGGYGPGYTELSQVRPSHVARDT